MVPASSTRQPAARLATRLAAPAIAVSRFIRINASLTMTPSTDGAM
jgi:hypothetical protein